MKKLKKLFPRLFRTPGARRGKKGSSLALVMMIGAALVIWVMCIAPLMTTTGTVAYKTQGDQTVYLAGRSAIEFCKAELSRVVDSGEYPYTFCVVMGRDADNNEVYVAYPKPASLDNHAEYDKRIVNDEANDEGDKKSADDKPDKTKDANGVAAGADVVAICAVDMKADGSYDIVMTSWDNCEKGQEYHATFVPTGSLKIHPEAYSDGDALPLSDFVLVDGQLGANTVWNSTITMNNAESLTFYESMLSSDKAPQDGFNATIYANAGEYPAVFKTTAHTALAENSSVGEEISEGYMSSDEDWIVPHCDTSRYNKIGYVFLNGQQVWIRTADGNAGAGGANTLNITDKCTLYYNGNPGYFSGKLKTYTVTASFTGTDYSGEQESGDVDTKYKEGEINILPFSGFELSLPEHFDESSSVVQGKHTVSGDYSVQKLDTVVTKEGNKEVTTYTVTLGYGVDNETKDILWDESLVYGCAKVNASGQITETKWQASNVFEGLSAPTDRLSYFFYVYKPATYNAETGKITGESDPVVAGQFYTLVPIQNANQLTNGNYVIVGTSNNKDYCLTLEGDALTAAAYSGQLYTDGDDALSGNTWTATKNSDGTWSFSNGGKYLSLSHGITAENANSYLQYWDYQRQGSRTPHDVHSQGEQGCYKCSVSFSLKYNVQIPYSFVLADSGKIKVSYQNGTNFNLQGQTSYEHKYALYSTEKHSYNPCSKVKNNQTSTYTVNLSRYLKLTDSVSASSSASAIKFYKALSIPSSAPALPSYNCGVNNVTYKATGFSLAELVTNPGAVTAIYANGNTIPMVDGKYYLNAGQYTIVVRAEENGISYWKNLGKLTVGRNTTDNQASHLNVTATIDAEDKFMIHVEATGWHTDGGYHYFGYRKAGSSDAIKWYSAVDVGYTLRLGFGEYEFYVKEVGSNNYGPVESGSVQQNIVMPTVSASDMDPGMFWYTLDDNGKPTWYKMPQDVYPSRVLNNISYNYTWERYGTITGNLDRTGNEWYNSFKGNEFTDSKTFLGIGYKYYYTLSNIKITIDAPGRTINEADRSDIEIELGPPMGQNQIGDHIASIMQGESLYFMGNPSINTHGNAVSLKTDLLVLNTQFTNDGVEGADNTISVQSYSGNSTIMVYAGANINNIYGQQIFAAGHFYEIPSGSNLWSLTSAEAKDLGTADSQTVKAKFRNKEYPNINMDIANASREQLGRIVSSETIGWTDRGVLSGSNSESNAAYCVTAYVTNVSGNVKYKANRVMMAGAKENNYSLNIPQGMEITTRYLSINADEVTGTSLMLYNLAQDQDFIQVLSNVLGITNSYSQTLQVDYERPNTRIGGTNMISQICRYIHGTNLLSKAADKQSLIATYSVDLIEDLFTGGLSGLASTVKTVDRYVSIKPSKNGSDTTIDLSALLSVNLNMYTNYVYFHPDVTEINLSSWLDSDVTISPQEDGYTTHEYLGLFQTHSADSYSGTILYFGNEMKVKFPDETVTIDPGFYRVKSGVSLRDFGNKSNIGGEGSKIEAILLFTSNWSPEQLRAGIDKLRSYSVYIDPATGEFSDAYVDTGLDSNDSGGLGGFSGGKVQ